VSPFASPSFPQQAPYPPQEGQDQERVCKERQGEVVGNICPPRKILADVVRNKTAAITPDFAVALVMAVLGISGAWNITRQASAELDVSNGRTLAPSV
jgi:hypothetical protein